MKQQVHTAVRWSLIAVSIVVVFKSTAPHRRTVRVCYAAYVENRERVKVVAYLGVAALIPYRLFPISRYSNTKFSEGEFCVFFWSFFFIIFTSLFWIISLFFFFRLFTLSWRNFYVCDKKRAERVKEQPSLLLFSVTFLSFQTNTQKCLTFKLGSSGWSECHVSSGIIILKSSKDILFSYLYNRSA